MGQVQLVTDICNNRANFIFETEKAVVTRCPTSFEFSTTQALHCWSVKQGIPPSKSKHKPIAVFEDIDHSRRWKDSLT